MISAIRFKLHFSKFASLLILSLAMASLIFAYGAKAQEASALPDYVIKQFGKPPAIPKGPLSKDLQAAVQTAFIDSLTQSSWGRDEMLALDEIIASKDPRLVWIISDLMRYYELSDLVEYSSTERLFESETCNFHNHCTGLGQDIC